MSKAVIRKCSLKEIEGIYLFRYFISYLSLHFILSKWSLTPSFLIVALISLSRLSLVITSFSYLHSLLCYLSYPEYYFLSKLHYPPHLHSDPQVSPSLTHSSKQPIAHSSLLKVSVSIQSLSPSIHM